ncbi:MAG: quinone-dependent dihydroorotate dehydrogenase [Magnetococcales bacterium]|nr:quinone-dependent dihydroorotate dehydrogenase [Magnetococcales bacterium]
MLSYKKHLSPLFDRLDSERMHKLVVSLLHYTAMIPGGCRLLTALFHPKGEEDFTPLRTTLAGLELESPVMIGAGWDKDALAVFALHALGFAAVEIGGVVEFPQYGRPKPRQFVIGPGVAINRLGFNSPGMEVVWENLQAYRESHIPIGINLARNENVPDGDAPAAYARVAAKLYQEGAFFTINVSCPNTPHLLHLQEKTYLTDIVQAVQATLIACGGHKPVFIKISPDLTSSALSDIIQVAMDNQVDGIVATNTTTNASIKGKYGPRWQNEFGGFSGDDDDYRQMTLIAIRQIYQETGGKLPIIGVGGVKDGPTALDKLRAGANAVQVVTSMRGEGLGVAFQIKSQMVAWMRQHGVHSLQEMIGNDHL